MCVARTHRTHVRRPLLRKSNYQENKKIPKQKRDKNLRNYINLTVTFDTESITFSKKSQNHM